MYRRILILLTVKSVTKGPDMFKKITVAKVNEQKGICLPPSIASVLNVNAGDTIYVVETDGSVRLLTKKSPLYKQLKAAHEAMEANKEALAMLAK